MVAALLFSRPAPAAEPFEQWLALFASEAIAQGISEPVVRTALAGVAPLPEILIRDKGQPEFVLSYAQYRARILTAANVTAGRKMLQKHAALLHAVGEKYGVQPRFIVAIWGIETRYGAVKPRVNVIQALATLAWDTRRPDFFRKELLQALRMLDAGYIELDRLQGSWAGAMGQPQFMPSSYMEYAQDWDADGRRDIWDNPGDVFASIANYLARHGWNMTQTWGRQVQVPSKLAVQLAALQRPGKSGCRAIDRLSPARPLAEWQAMGIRRITGADLPAINMSASLVFPDGGQGTAYIVYGNYETTLRYNCAHFYALTVGAIADQITGGL